MQVEILKVIQKMSNSFLDKVFIRATMMGEEYFLIFVTVMIFWCINKKVGYKLGFVVLTSSILNSVIKDVFHALLVDGKLGDKAKAFFHINRPIGEPGIRSLRVKTATGWSFPSGHTQETVSLWGTLMLTLRKRWVYSLGTVYILLVGFSRLYLGVHWPSDVVGGLIIGVLWTLLACWVFDKSYENHNKALLLCAIVPMLFGMLYWKESSYYKLCGMLCGFYIGYNIEDKFINFNVNASFWDQIIKLLSGIAVIFLIKIVVKLILPVSIISNFIRYFIIGLWVTAGAPFTFKRFIHN